MTGILLNIWDDEAFWFATTLRGDESVLMTNTFRDDTTVALVHYPMFLSPNLFISLIREGEKYRPLPPPKEGPPPPPAPHRPLLFESVKESDILVLRAHMIDKADLR